jgi:hypothetical protein
MHIVLVLPLYSISRKIIFINIAPFDKRTFILKKPKFLKQEPHDIKDIIVSSVIGKYIARPPEFENICLVEYDTWYSCSNPNPKKRKHLCAI